MRYLKAFVLALAVVFTTSYIVILVTEPVDYTIEANLLPYSPGKTSKDSVAIYRLAFSDNVTCSGFVIDDNYMITSAHCIHHPKDPVMVIGKGGIYNVMAVRTKQDLALIGGDFKGDSRVEIDFNDNGLAYQYGISIGFPGNQRSVLLSGMVILGGIDAQIIAQGDIYRGMSGGPLVVYRGDHIRIVGVNHATDDNHHASFSSIEGADKLFGI